MGLDRKAAEDAAGIQGHGSSRFGELIAREVARGIPAKRIVLAGFSQGGAVSLYTVPRLRRRWPASWRCPATCRGKQLSARNERRPMTPRRYSWPTDSADPMLPMMLGDEVAGFSAKARLYGRVARLPHGACGLRRGDRRYSSILVPRACPNALMPMTTAIYSASRSHAEKAAMRERDRRQAASPRRPRRSSSRRASCSRPPRKRRNRPTKRSRRRRAAIGPRTRRGRRAAELKPRRVGRRTAARPKPLPQARGEAEPEVQPKPAQADAESPKKAAVRRAAQAPRTANARASPATRCARRPRWRNR